jgi:DNA-binding transcriptional LysR family regulator
MKENQMRHLSFDDLLILSLLANGTSTVTKVAKNLCLTQPAITRRIRKMERVFAEKIVMRANRGIKMTEFGQRTALRAQRAILAMTEEIVNESECVQYAN